MTRPLPTSVCVLAVLAVPTLAQERHSQLTAPALTLSFAQGQPTGLTNALTGESLAASPGDKSLALLWRQTPLAAPVDGSVSAAGAPRRWTIRFTGADGSECTTTYSTDDAGDVLVRQSGKSQRRGLSGVQWGIAGISTDSVEVIVPGMSGVAFTSGRAPFSSLHFDWPTGWEASMVLLQQKRGGFMIWTEDPELRFKALQLIHSQDRLDLRFQSHNFAPFDELTEVESVEWRITPYKGDWRVAAEKYRQSMAKRFELTPLSKQQPAWANDIRFVVIMGMQTDVLDRLAKRVVPERTLLYIPNWRRDRYDVNYPDYTADDKFGPFVAYAHKLGFRVMPHVNYFGCTESNPVYERFKAYHLRDPVSKQPLYWVPPLSRDKEEAPPQKFAYMNPACKEWRALLIERYREIYDNYGVDALHLDQTICIPNHGGGLVDGVSVPQGNLLFHKELREALPQVALSGEGLDEVTLPYEAFAQRHASRAVDHVHGTWNDAFIACAHPISSYLFLPYNTIYGYLGLTNPSNEGLYRGWKRAYENWGVIPTFARPAVRQLDEPTAEVRVLLEEASLWTKQRLRPDFTGDWSPPIKFRHRGDGGQTVLVRRSDKGGSTCLVSAAAGQRELYRYVCGVNQIEGPGNLDGWAAYDDRALFGLRPKWTYLLVDEPRDFGAPHLSALPPNTVLGEVRRDDSKFVVELRNLSDDRYYDFCERIGEGRAGTMVDGEEHDLERGGNFTVTDLTCAGSRKRSVFAHPPWQGIAGQPASGLGQTFGEFRVAIPRDREAVLSFAIGLRDGVNDRSDGVTFTVLADGKPVFRKHWARSEWDPHEVDLTPFAGSEVVIRFITDPGPANDVSFDWAVWGEPVVRLQSGRRPGRIEFTCPRRVTQLVSSDPEAELPDASGKEGEYVYPCNLTLPSKTAFLWQEPTEVTLPLDLAKTPFTLGGTIGGHAAKMPLEHCATSAGEGTSKGEKRSGLGAHPPNNGKVYADYLLELPAAKRITLALAVALRDGSQSDGCRFRIEANCRELWDQLLTGPDGWHPAEVDLTAFAGKTLLLSLIVDSEGSFYYDWAFWAEPKIVAERTAGDG